MKEADAQLAMRSNVASSALQMNKLVAALLAGFLMAALGQTHAQATGASGSSGSVEGHVICDDGGSPARLATVRLLPLAKVLDEKGPAPSAPPDMWTDLDGYYVFPSVQPGRYIVVVHKDGYVKDLSLFFEVSGDFTPDQQRELLAAFPQVTVTSGGDSRRDVVIHRGGAISGRVSFDSGGVLNGGGSEVTATMVSSSIFDRPDMGVMPKDFDFSQTVKTDDRGVYRISGLPQGKYRIQVRLTEPQFDQLQWMDSPTRTGRADLTVFSPEALSKANARIVDVGDGDEITDVDINIPTRMLHSIGGVVTQHGAPLEHARITIRPQGQKLDPLNWWAALTISDGSYRFDLMPSGTYIIEAKLWGKGLPASAGHAITVVVGDSNVLDANIDFLDKQTPTK